MCLKDICTPSLLPLLGQAPCQLQEGTEQGGAIIVQQFDEASLLHEAAKLDELAGAGPALLHPVAGVGAGLSKPHAVKLGVQMLELSLRLL